MMTVIFLNQLLEGEIIKGKSRVHHVNEMVLRRVAKICSLLALGGKFNLGPVVLTLN